MWRDNAAERVPPRQHDAATVHIGRGKAGRCGSGIEPGTLDQRTAASRANGSGSSRCKHGVALAANSLHVHRLPRIAQSSRNGLPQPRFQAVPGRRPHPDRYTVPMHPPVRLVAIDIDGTLLPTFSKALSPRNAQALRAAQVAGITVAIATGRRTAYTAPLFEGLGLQADMPLITSNGAVTRTLGGDAIDCFELEARVARGLCGLLRPFGTMVFTFDTPGAGDLVLEDLEQAHERIAVWVEANRNAIRVVKPLEGALEDGANPIQGMVTGGLHKMMQAEQALKASEWAGACECIRTEYPARDLSILDLLPPGVSKGWALERLAGRLGVDRKETMAIGDNWNDVNMLEWAGQSILMGNAAADLKSLAKNARLEAGSPE